MLILDISVLKSLFIKQAKIYKFAFTKLHREPTYW